MLSFLRQTWLVLLLSVGFGISLAAVEGSLKPMIEANAQARLERAVLEVVPGGASSQAVELKGQTVYLVRDAAGGTAGWGVPAASTGFVDKIRLMVGLSADGTTITGIAVLFTNETPGLGDKIKDEDFRQNFVGKPTNVTLKVVKAGETAEYPIHAITGATISSKAVTKAVNEQVRFIREAISQAAASGAGREGQS